MLLGKTKAFHSDKTYFKSLKEFSDFLEKF